MENRWSLKNKKALITGGTRGIGLAIAEEFLALGAQVFIVARSSEEVHNRLKLWTDKNVMALGCVADVTCPADQEEIIQRINKEWGQLDILINNAGTNIRKKTVEYTPDEYEKIFLTNITAGFEMCRRCYSLLCKSQSAAIVNISSVAGLTHLHSMTPYGMAKAALIQMTRDLAVEWASDGIRVNAVAPWYIKTSLTNELLQEGKYLSSVLSQTPMARTGEPEEVATATAFLCMPVASYISGHCMVIDGGFTSMGL